MCVISKEPDWLADLKSEKQIKKIKFDWLMSKNTVFKKKII